MKCRKRNAVRQKGKTLKFWKAITFRWSREELKSWTTIRRTAYILLPLLFYYVAHDIAQVLLWGMTEFMIQRGGERVLAFAEKYADTLRAVISALAILAGMAVIRGAAKGEISFRDKTVETGKERTTAYLLLMVLSFGLSMGINILFYQIGFTGSSEGFERVYKQQYGVVFFIGLILYGVISPLAEEMVFRGLIYNRMKRCFSLPVAIVVSSLLFGCYHGNPVQAVYGFLMGLAIAWSYEGFGSFAAPVWFHAVANISVYALTYQNALAAMSRQGALAAGIGALTAAGLIAGYLHKNYFVTVHG